MPKPANRTATKHRNVFKIKDGLFWVRGQAVDPRTGRTRESSWYVETNFVDEARDKQVELMAKLRSANATATSSAVLRFQEFGPMEIERRWSLDIITSYETKNRYEWELGQLNLYWGNFYLDRIDETEVEKWRIELGRRMKDTNKGQPDYLSPWTAKGIISLFKLVMKSASKRWKFMDPARELMGADTGKHRTYTKEQPNSLTPSELGTFLAYIKRRFPQRYAMFVLGFFTGRRPCELRPLRRKGPEADLNWETGELQIRQSLVRSPKGQKPVPRKRTKTGQDLEITLPKGLLDELWRHVNRLEGAAAESDLLFPAKHGGFLSNKCLNQSIKKAMEELKLTKHLTPRFMRRTVQDIARKAELQMVVLQSLTGHATAAMVKLYSTPYAEEQAAGIAAMAKAANVSFDEVAAVVEDQEKAA